MQYPASMYDVLHCCTWTRRRTSTCMCADCIDIRRHTQGLRKPYNVQNTAYNVMQTISLTNSNHIIGHLLHTLHYLLHVCCVVCIRLETELNSGCQLREDVEWAKYRSNNVRVERCNGILSRPTGRISRAIHSCAFLKLTLPHSDK